MASKLATAPTVVITPPVATGSSSNGHPLKPSRRLSVPSGPALSPPIRSPAARRHSTVQVPSPTSIESPRHPPGGPQQQRRLNPLTEFKATTAFPAESGSSGSGAARRPSIDSGRQVRSRKQSAVDAPTTGLTVRADEVIDALVKRADDELISGHREPLSQPSSEFALVMQDLEAASTAGTRGGP